MPGNSFIKFDGVKGESKHITNSGDKGWIEISDWSWDIEADTSYLKGGGAAVGKPQPGTLSFSHYYDKSSPAIMSKIVMGKHFPKVWIVMLKQTGQVDGQGEAYFGLTMQQCFITKVSSKGAEDGSVTQDVEMVFKIVAAGYRAQKEDGSLEPQMNFGWDIGQMQVDNVAGAELTA